MAVQTTSGDPLQVRHWGVNSGTRGQVLLDATTAHWVEFDAAAGNEAEQRRLTKVFVNRYGVHPVR